MGERDLTIVIPAFNEAHRLPNTLDRLMADLPSACPGAWEIVVSDDGSRDETAQIVRDRAADPRVRIVSSEVNKGKGAALVAGLLAAVHPYVLFLDADLPVPVGTLVAFLEVGADSDMVVGSRRLPGASFDPPQPLVRRAGGRLFRMAVTALGYDVTSDPQCGVKLVQRDRIGPLLGEVTCGGFAFDVELIERSRRAGMRIAELPVQWRHVPGSSLRPVRDALSTLTELARLRGELQRSLVAVP